MKTLIGSLTKFEKYLWSFSVIVIILSALMSQPVDYLNLLASLIGVTALIFLAKGYVLGQGLTIVFSVFYGVISFFFHYYGEVITYIGMTAPMAALAMVSWIRHPYDQSREVEVKQISKKEVSCVLLLSVAVTIVFYYILKQVNNANLLFSTISITTSFIASALTFLRSPFYAVGYMANDVILIILWILASMESTSYLPMVACFSMFLLNDLYGFLNWRRMACRQQR